MLYFCHMTTWCCLFNGVLHCCHFFRSDWNEKRMILSVVYCCSILILHIKQCAISVFKFVGQQYAKVAIFLPHLIACYIVANFCVSVLGAKSRIILQLFTSILYTVQYILCTASCLNSACER